MSPCTNLTPSICLKLSYDEDYRLHAEEVYSYYCFCTDLGVDSLCYDLGPPSRSGSDINNSHPSLEERELVVNFNELVCCAASISFLKYLHFVFLPW